MNREIKFRAFIAGVMKPIAILHNTPHPARVLDMDFDTNHVNATLFPVETPVMQYTGLKDKNGKEIYEGDIVRCVNEYNYVTIGKVVWLTGGFAITGIKHPDTDAQLYTWFSYQVETEVIGNIHENPELRK